MFLITWMMVLLSRLVFTNFGGCPWSRTIISPMVAVSAYLKRLSNVPFLPWVQSLRCLGPERCVFLLQQTRRSGSGKYRWNTHRIPVARTVLSVLYGQIHGVTVLRGVTVLVQTWSSSIRLGHAFHGLFLSSFRCSTRQTRPRSEEKWSSASPRRTDTRSANLTDAVV